MRQARETTHFQPGDHGRKNENKAARGATRMLRGHLAPRRNGSLSMRTISPRSFIFLLPSLPSLLCSGCGGRLDLDELAPTPPATLDAGSSSVPGSGAVDGGTLPSNRPDANTGGPDANTEDASFVNVDVGVEDASADGSGDAAPACVAGETECSGACVVLGGDNVHCGTCGVACASGESCVDGGCASGVSVWPTFGGNVRHDGFNATETGTPPLTLAWTAPLGSGQIAAAASDGNAIYVTETLHSVSSNVTNGWALSPADGTILWTHHLGSAFSAGQVTVDRGHLYVAHVGSSEGAQMDSLVATTGALVWTSVFDAQWDEYWAPLVVGGRIYFDGGRFGGLYGADQATGTQLFFAMEGQASDWSPLSLNGEIYTFVDAQLEMLDPVSGATLKAAAGPWSGNDFDPFMTPVSDGTNIFVVSPPSLVAFSPSIGSALWTAAGGSTNTTACMGEPAVANGVVYALCDGGLRAHDATTGAVLWTFAGDGTLSYPPVVAGHYVYVASDADAYAVDVTTQAQVWTTSPGGWLSIANGQLYVAMQGGTLAAWQLTR
jgi:hypothetical protein